MINTTQMYPFLLAPQGEALLDRRDRGLIADIEIDQFANAPEGTIRSFVAIDGRRVPLLG